MCIIQTSLNTQIRFINIYSVVNETRKVKNVILIVNEQFVYSAPARPIFFIKKKNVYLNIIYLYFFVPVRLHNVRVVYMSPKIIILAIIITSLVV